MTGRQVELAVIVVLALVVAGMTAAAFAVNAYDAAADGSPFGAAVSTFEAYVAGAALPALIAGLWRRF